MRKNIENIDPNCDSWNDLLQWSKTKTNNEILEVFSDSDWWVTFFNYCKNHGIERKDGKELCYRNCMDTSIVYVDKDGKEYKLYSSGADFHEDAWAAAEYAFVEIPKDIEKQEKDEEFESSLNWKQINRMWNYRIFTSFWSVLIVIDDNDKFWVLNLKWEKIVECEYDRIDEYWITKKWGKYWLINRKWKIIKSEIYDNINRDFYDETFLVEKDWKRGALDNQWNEILECRLTYDCVECWGEWVYKVQKDWKYGIIDKKWNLILPIQYDHIDFRDDGWDYIVKLGWKVWVVNDKRQLIPIQYDEISRAWRSRDENSYKVRLNWKYWLIDNKGWEILPIQYEEIDDVISKWKYKVKSAWWWRIVNNKWETIKELQYKNSEELDRWVNIVELDGFEYKYGEYSKYWLIDSHWHEILPIQYHRIRKISKWMYEVWDQEFMWVVDKNWVEIIPVIYEYLRVLKSDKNLLLVKNKSWKYWIINMENEIIIPFEFDMIREEYFNTWKFWKNECNVYVQKGWKLWQLVL